MAGLDPAIQSLNFFLDGRLKGGHDHGIGADVRVIVFREDGCTDPSANFA
jgi:hypothetical protein